MIESKQLAPVSSPSPAPAVPQAAVVAFDYVDEARTLPICVCSICDEPFIDPVEVPSCQHTFCAKCINACQRASGCPVCRAVLPPTSAPLPPSTDKTLLRLLDDLPVYCANKRGNEVSGGGCAWTGPRGNLAEHLARGCDKCGISCARNDRLIPNIRSA